MKILAALALSAVSLVAVASPADAATTTVDCSAGPVTLRGSGETYALTGDCSRVTVAGSNLTVTLGSAEKVVLRTSTSRLRADDAGVLRVTGATNRITVAKARSLTLRGASNRVALTRVPTVTVRGASNRVVVRQGRTQVKVVGASNVVTVPKKR